MVTATAPAPLGTVNTAGTLEINQDALREALRGLIPAAPEPLRAKSGASEDVAHMSGFGNGFLPNVGDIKAAAMGGAVAVFTAKAIGKLLPIVSDPVLADAVAWGLLSKFGGSILKGEAREVARHVLLVDALRGLVPAFDAQVNSVVQGLPSVGPNKPFTFPKLGSGSRGAAMAQGGGSGRVLNRLQTSNI